MDANGRNEQAEYFRKDRTDYRSQQGVDPVDKAQYQPGNPDNDNDGHRRGDKAMLRIGDKDRHHSTRPGKDGTGYRHGANMRRILFLFLYDAAHERAKDQMINRNNNKQQSAGCHEVIDTDAEKLRENALSREDENEKNNGCGDNPRAKGAAP